MARSPNREDGYGLQPSAWTGPTRPTGPSAAKKGGRGSNPPPSPLPAAPPQVDDEAFKWEVAAIADAIAAETLRLPFGSSFTVTASYDGPQRRAASVTLRGLPPMTIEEAVKADLLSLFGVNQAVYQTTRAAIEALVAQEEESRR